MDDPKSVTQEELQDNYEADTKKYYVAREDRLYKLSQGSATAVWAHDEIVKQDNLIAELENQWISVFDMLPDTGRVLATGNGYESEVVVFLKFVGGGGKFKAKGRDCTESVTHWMPLGEEVINVIHGLEKRNAELEDVLRDITNEAKEVLTNARNTPAVRRQLEMSGSIKHYIVPRHSIISAENCLKEQGE